MNAPFDYGQLQEAEHERFMFELELCQKIDRAGLHDEALYVAASLGLKTEFQQEKNHAMEG